MRQFPDHACHASFSLSCISAYNRCLVSLESVFDITSHQDADRNISGISKRDALREGGRVVTYGFQSKMRRGRMASHTEGRHRFRESAQLSWYILRNWFKPGRKKMVPYSIQC